MKPADTFRTIAIHSSHRSLDIQPGNWSTTGFAVLIRAKPNLHRRLRKTNASLLDAAKVLGFDDKDFPINGTDDQKREVLRRWEHQQERFLLKPMNCPHHAQMYKALPRSYRDLPVRLAEFGTVYRHEQSGELNGMLRVRGLTQDDAHLFCTPEQVEQEFKETLGLVKFVLEAVGLDDYRVQLSSRDPNSDKYVGSDELWENAENTLRKVLTEEGMPFVECQGKRRSTDRRPTSWCKDCLGREWQLGHRAAGLQSAGTLRTGIHRCGQQSASSGDDSSRTVWIDGTILWRADRTFRRCVSAVAGSGTDSRVAI